jgi:spermidine synthase
MPVTTQVSPLQRSISTPWPALAIVAGSSFATLVLELVVGRVLAPAIGVSLYTWTAIIGVVLGGLAVGNDLGGRFARTSRPAPILEASLFGASACTIAIAIVSKTFAFEDLAMDWPPVLRLFVFVAACGLLPCVLLGMIGPLVAHQVLATRETADTGPVIGRLNAVGTAASLAGAFGTGFVFVPFLGTRTTLAMVSVLLAGLGLIANHSNHRRRSRVALVVAIGALGIWVVLSSAAAHASLMTATDQRQPSRVRAGPTECLTESAYSCIRIDWSSVGQVDYGVMRLDRAIPGRAAPEAPRLLLSPIAQALADMIVMASGHTGRTPMDAGSLPPTHALFIGGGSYTLPRYLEAIAPGSRIDVIEIDPDVTAAATRWFGVHLVGPVGALPGPAPRQGIFAHHADARRVIRSLPDGLYDVVIGDAFADMAVPWHLTTVEFTREVARVMQPDGRYAVNVIDGWPGGQFLPAYLRTLADVFPQTDLLSTAVPGIEPYGPRQNWVATAGASPIDAEDLAKQSRPGFPDNRPGIEPSRARLVMREPMPAGSPAPADPLAGSPAWVAIAQDMAPLTDDRAPVDWYLASRVTD